MEQEAFILWADLIVIIRIFRYELSVDFTGGYGLGTVAVVGTVDLIAISVVEASCASTWIDTTFCCQGSCGECGS
jgi:hypothetical protein